MVPAPRMLRDRLLVSSLLLLLAACGEPSDETEIDEGEALTETLRAREGDTTVWVDRYVARRGDSFAIHGRTSRNLTEEGTGFIFDDIYGAYAKKSARTFDMSYGLSEIGVMTEGTPLFLRTNYLPSAGRPDSLTARVRVRPRLESMSGSSYLQFTQELTPVVYGGRTVYRVRGKFTKTPFTSFHAQAGDYALTDVRRVGNDRFEIDLQFEHARDILNGGAQFKVVAVSGAKNYQKTAELRLAVMELDLTAGDASEVWPPRTCTSEIQSCLALLPAGTADLSSCGEAYEVRACPLTGGVVFDDTTFNAAMTRARPLLGQLEVDAAALVGAARTAQLVEGASQTIESRLEQLFGGYYASAAARDAAAAEAVDGGLDVAYARPLDLVEAIQTNAARLNDVAADALLLELAHMDLASTEFGRSLEVLAHDYRARHLASIAELRNGGAELIENGSERTYVSRWLDAYVEVTVSADSGSALRVYVEID